MLGHIGSRLSSGGSGSVLLDALEVSSLNALGVDLDQVPALDLSLLAEQQQEEPLPSLEERVRGWWGEPVKW